MGKVTIIAEKPKQAQAYAEALKPNTKKNGYIEISPNSIFPNGAYLTWAYGHLLELAKPSHYDDKWKAWRLDNLPINPNKFEFLVKESSKDQFEVIRSLISKSDEIVVATDTDREGENIAWSIISHVGASEKKIKRLWINSLETDAIEQGFQTLKDGKKYYPSYIEAQTRQISDWLIGMNASQLFTLLLKEKGVSDVFSVGRVQTPTLFMIYQREREIEEFKSKPFYEIIGEVNHYKGKFTVKTEGKFETKDETADFLKSNSVEINKAVNTEIEDVSSTEEKESSPKLFTMSGIQTRANKLWKYSPAKILEIVQSLYEKKLVSYPRTDTPFITLGEFQYLKERFEEYKKVLGVDFQLYQTDPLKRYVNPDKVQEHYAIIPTRTIPTEGQLKSLSTEELNIYLEVVKNTLAMFHEPYRYNKTTISVKVGQLDFKATGKVEVNKGWRELYPVDETKEDAPPLPLVDKGDPIQVTPKLKEGKTTKPKRLTEGDLIPLMINAGKKLEGEEQAVLKETEGIGTEATRANIIETLKKQHYIEVKKNLVYITKKGSVLSEVVDGTLLASPSLTAKWEEFLKKIGKGERDQETFLKSIYTFIDKLVLEMPSKMTTESVQDALRVQSEEKHIGACPSCEKGHIVDLGAFYACDHRNSGCKQSFSKKILEKTISEAQLKKILVKGKSDTIKGFKGKNKPFDAYLTLEPDAEKGTKKLKFNF